MPIKDDFWFRDDIRVLSREVGEKGNHQTQFLFKLRNMEDEVDGGNMEALVSRQPSHCPKL